VLPEAPFQGRKDCEGARGTRDVFGADSYKMTGLRAGWF